jgi:hypothetical protein
MFLSNCNIKNMNTTKVLFLIVLVFLGYYHLITLRTEPFTYGPFTPIEATRSVDPLVCYPGTYWRNGTYNDICKPMNNKRPLRMTSSGEKLRAPEAKYELVCSVDEHLKRNCQFVKVYNQYY